MAPFDFTENEAAYRCLWLAVLHRAKQDAEARNMMCECNLAERPKIQKEALDFLTVPGKELEWVAWAAGVRMESLLEVGSECRRICEEQEVNETSGGGEHELRDQQLSSQAGGSTGD